MTFGAKKKKSLAAKRDRSRVLWKKAATGGTILCEDAWLDKRLVRFLSCLLLPQANAYRCPAGERLIWRYTSIEDGKTQDTYWSSACPGCAMHDRCTTGKYRRIKRWEHESVLEAVQERLERKPETMRLRRQTVEHPFGTIKSWMGYTHFLTKTLPRVRTEMSLQVLAYNLKRVMNILGTGPLLEAMRA